MDRVKDCEEGRSERRWGRIGIGGVRTEGWGRRGDVEVEGRVRSGGGLRLDGRWRGSGMRRWSGREIKKIVSP